MPGVTSVIIVDDESAARRGLARLLQAHSDVVVLGEAEDVPSAVRLLAQHVPDAVFLDIELPRGSGFDLIEKLHSSTRVVFVTGHPQHAALAFEVEALDYLLKPVRSQRLAQTLDRLRRVSGRLTSTPDAPAPFNLRDHLCLNSGGRTFIAPVDRIAALRADGDFCRVYIEDQPALLLGYSLGRYESMLPSPPFVRIGRSLIINLSRVKEFTSASRNEALLQLEGVDESFALRRLAAARLRSLISNLSKSRNGAPEESLST